MYRPINTKFDDGINKYWVAERSAKTTVSNDQSLEAVKYCQVDSDGRNFFIHWHNAHTQLHTQLNNRSTHSCPQQVHSWWRDPSHQWLSPWLLPEHPQQVHSWWRDPSHQWLSPWLLLEHPQQVHSWWRDPSHQWLSPWLLLEHSFHHSFAVLAMFTVNGKQSAIIPL